MNQYLAALGAAVLVYTHWLAYGFGQDGVRVSMQAQVTDAEAAAKRVTVRAENLDRALAAAREAHRLTQKELSDEINRLATERLALSAPLVRALQRPRSPVPRLPQAAGELVGPPAPTAPDTSRPASEQEGGTSERALAGWVAEVMGMYGECLKRVNEGFIPFHDGSATSTTR